MYSKPRNEKNVKGIIPNPEKTFAIVFKFPAAITIISRVKKIVHSQKPEYESFCCRFALRP